MLPARPTRALLLIAFAVLFLLTLSLTGLMSQSTADSVGWSGSRLALAQVAPTETPEETLTPTAPIPTSTPTVTPTLPPCQPGDVPIDIRNFAFGPATIVMCLGYKVIWTNQDDFSHTTTGSSRVWDSGLLRKGQSFELRMDRPGAFAYYCTPHQFMRGVVLVSTDVRDTTATPTATATVAPSPTPSPSSTTGAPPTRTSTTTPTVVTPPTPSPTTGAVTPTTPPLTLTPSPSPTRVEASRTPTLTVTPTPTPTQVQASRTPTPTATQGHTHPPTVTPGATSSLLDPLSIPKFAEPLLIPPAMPLTAQVTDARGQVIDYYEIAARQIQQHILPRSLGLPATTVWGYGSVHHPGSFSYPAYTLEAQVNRPVRIKWINDLVDSQGAYLPPLFAVDQTLHWANPAGGLEGRDGHNMEHGPYRGPVPLVTHLHGAHTTDDSDGYPEAWTLPAAHNIPAGYATEGTWYAPFNAQFARREGVAWAPGSSVYQYPNDQPAGTLWYHDHTLGITRLTVYAGLAGFYQVRGGPHDLPDGLPGPAPARGDAPNTAYYEIPLLIQDRSFNRDGSLYFPDSRAIAEGLTPDRFQIPFMHDPACGGLSDVPPIWTPDFFGNTLVTNGRTWPYLEVEARRYRLRLLNGSNSRFLILKLSNGAPLYQIGAEGGFLPQVVRLDELILGPAERADVIVDFTQAPIGSRITLLNLGPDTAFHGGRVGLDFIPADPNTTGQVLQFRVVTPTSADPSTPPLALVLPTPARLGPADMTRQLSLTEFDSQTVFVTRRGNDVVLDCQSNTPITFVEARLGTLNAFGGPNPLTWDDAITETPTIHTTEVWEIHNFTTHAHPIHIHQVMFEVVNREGRNSGIVRPPAPNERGFKDTVIAYPGDITRVKLRFDLPGRYVWHCHLLGHEDNEMMRPLEVSSYKNWLPLVRR